MLIHIFSASPHHYLPMRKFCIDAAKGIEQQFWVPGEGLGSKAGFREYGTNRELLDMLRNCNDSARFVFHGLFDPNLIRNLMGFRRLADSVCIIWGAELYRYNTKLSLKGRINRFIHSLVLKKFHHVYSLNHGDAKLLERFLGVKKSKVLPYPLIDFSYCNQKALTSSRLKIVVGNSGAPSNNHIAIFEKLALVKGLKCELIVPLNYGGDADYIEKVIQIGKLLFAERFKPIINMLHKQHYDELLSSADMLIFAHDRQQGLYAVYAMLMMGKPIFLNSHTTSYKALKEIGFNLFDFTDLDSFSFNMLNELAQRTDEENQRLMSENFTEQALLPKWNKMFMELAGK
ncbi:TDP-N-acetylfucosamine:lipid II N-acetylfucosaminyltransferase [Pseudoalteromonas sp. S16_S37]|uniref:TDP-N-acetylfucosamine:lipid II N-acetylfucosaminyltransferase n=1 Tax=Pseudoalteromonas sp. S16_S37 TaxID=2720228 RepID=UPI001681B918|nr:TDP-N-acetylfucosamine:lipid II N-acetylfucosaminyltransferase [Pseudoalteromonas sp. S16_S37]MBD1580967.1 TDP-N-acetylfucosamine:lipid II N-acetylfucosaminyltransferase [Pseudoalteromonas sp. S16_S37]